MEQKQKNLSEIMIKSIAIMIGTITIVFLALDYYLCPKTQPQKEMLEQNESYNPLKQDAYVESQTYAKNMLVSPATAEFPFLSDDEIEQWDENTFVINSYVDSQNKFGAMLRSYYQCKIIYSPDGTATVENFKMH